MNEIINWMLALGGFLVLLFGLMQFLTHGFIFKFLKIKGSRGKHFGVLVRGKLDEYMAIGHLEDGMVVYKTRVGKQRKRLAVDSNDNPFFRWLGVNWVQVDEEKNALVMRDFSSIEGYDSDKFESLLVRALYKPTPATRMDKIILIGIMVLGVGLFIIGYMVYNLDQTVRGLGVV